MTETTTSAPRPVDLMRAAGIALTARQDTSAGLLAREHLAPMVGDMVAEIGTLRETVAAYREDLEDARAESNLARSVRLEWPSIRTAVDPNVHTGARTIAYLKAHGWSKDHDRRGGEDWHDQPDRDGKMRFAFVPLDTSFVDWDKRMAELVHVLADLNGTGELGVLADIAEAGR